MTHRRQVGAARLVDKHCWCKVCVTMQARAARPIEAAFRYPLAHMALHSSLRAATQRAPRLASIMLSLVSEEQGKRIIILAATFRISSGLGAPWRAGEGRCCGGLLRLLANIDWYGARVVLKQGFTSELHS